MGRRQHWARWTLLTSATLGLVCGIVLLALGLWTMHDKAFLEELLRNRLYMNTTYTILVSSILMILLSGFGWFAAVKEIKCFLLTYFVLLFLLSIITMVGGVLAYVFREQVAWTMKAEMVTEVRNYLPDQPEAPVTRAWDMTQSQLGCCGLMTEQVEESWQVWRKNQALNPAVGGSVALPSSCCSPSPPSEAGQCVGGQPEVHEGDCYLLALDLLQQHAATLGAAAIVVTCLMIPVMASSLVMFRSMV